MANVIYSFLNPNVVAPYACSRDLLFTCPTTFYSQNLGPLEFYFVLNVSSNKIITTAECFYKHEANHVTFLVG